MHRDMPVRAHCCPVRRVVRVGRARADSAGTTRSRYLRTERQHRAGQALEYAFVAGTAEWAPWYLGSPSRKPSSPTIVGCSSLGSREILPDLAGYLPEIRRTIREKAMRKPIA